MVHDIKKDTVSYILIKDQSNKIISDFYSHENGEVKEWLDKYGLYKCDTPADTIKALQSNNMIYVTKESVYNCSKCETTSITGKISGIPKIKLEGAPDTINDAMTSFMRLFAENIDALSIEFVIVTKHTNTINFSRYIVDKTITTSWTYLFYYISLNGHKEEYLIRTLK